MMQSMLAAVSGLQMNQMAMNAIGNNIANVNTPGFKSSRVDFTELFTQTLQGATAPTSTSGGVAPSQIGLGVTLGGIDVNMSQGSLETTGNNLDLAIQGNGYFVLQNGAGQQVYTRVGDLSIDADGNLVQKGTGDLVLGWAAANGTPGSTSAPPTALKVPIGTTIAPVATTTITFAGNLDATATTSYTVPETVYDSLGNAQTVDITFAPTGTANQWTWTAGTSATFSGSGTLTFNSDGSFSSVNGDTLTTASTLADGATSMTVVPDFSALTQYAQANSAYPALQNGSQPGSLISETVDKSGNITGSFSNGKTEVLGQIALASFSNPAGLLQQGSGLWAQSNDSGTPDIGAANTAGRGSVQGSSLEQSNVDLSTEFTNMIEVERGYEANAKVVTTGNQMLAAMNQMVQ